METYSRILPWRISETEEQATVHIVSKSQTLNEKQKEHLPKAKDEMKDVPLSAIQVFSRK